MAYLLSVSIVTGGIVWGFFGWISSKLSVIYNRIEKAQEVILNKLEYHERHDDKRFGDVGNELWAIKVRNAAKDGHFTLNKESKDTDGVLRS